MLHLPISCSFFRFISSLCPYSHCRIGGEYPLSATISSESAKTESRGATVGLVFAMQGWGNFAAGLLGWALVKGLQHQDHNYEIAWRTMLAFGGLPGLLTVYFRYQMEESKIFAKHVLHNDEGGPEEGDEQLAQSLLPPAEGSPSLGSPSLNAALPEEDAEPEHASGCEQFLDTLGRFKWVLLGTAGSWFLFDVTFYGNGIFATKVIETLEPELAKDKDNMTYDDLIQFAMWKMVITAIALPGYYLGAFTIDIFGRRPLQMAGFLLTGVTFVILALAGDKMSPIPVIIVYGLSFMFANWGPNTTSYVIPAESFPTWARATCHGLSAASGKLGAVVGSFGLGTILEEKHGSDWSHIETVLWICVGVSVVGFAWTWLFTHDMIGYSLDDLDNPKFVPEYSGGLSQFFSSPDGNKSRTKAPALGKDGFARADVAPSSPQVQDTAS